ncbi:hypothetical protein BS50DRAFT_254048 [Corynespora cassiicola Philippines]|uniref:Uncharacterized protein n=1 Tax=Corynespora cassiicola Philippines TaxID=1448308 RepID=A0A2T2P4H9_CORCC|nr:hypothetical protein BS50DRAFT_254048 [Corynespora cassiicola Philippines]
MSHTLDQPSPRQMVPFPTHMSQHFSTPSNPRDLTTSYIGIRPPRLRTRLFPLPRLASLRPSPSPADRHPSRQAVTLTTLSKLPTSCCLLPPTRPPAHTLGHHRCRRRRRPFPASLPHLPPCLLLALPNLLDPTLRNPKANAPTRPPLDH